MQSRAHLVAGGTDGPASFSLVDHRGNNFDAIRLVLAIFVVISHCFKLCGTAGVTEPLAVLTRGQLNFGNLGVAWFFVVSGFLVTQSYCRSTTVASYLRKRISRIYPGFIVAMAVCAWVVVPLGSQHAQEVWRGEFVLAFVARTALLIGFQAPPTFESNPVPLEIDSPIWTIPQEFCCYLGVAALGMIGWLGRRRLVVGLFLASLALCAVIAVTEWTPAGRVPGVNFALSAARLVPFFLSGTVFYLYRDRIRFQWRGGLAALIGLGVASQVPHALSIALPPLGTYLLLWFALSQRANVHNAARFGDFSYGIYLYHYPILQLLMLWIGQPTDPWRLLAMGLPLSIVAGVLSWHLVERWFLTRLRQQERMIGPSAAGAG